MSAVDDLLVGKAIDAVLAHGFWALAPSGEMADEIYKIEIPIDVVDRTEPEMSRIAAKTSAFEKKMLLTERRLRAVSTGFTTAGRSMTRNFTYPIVGGFALASKAAIDFERDFAGVEKTVDASRKQLNSLRSEIRAFARRTGHSTTEISAVAEAAGQLGIHVPEIMNFTRVMLEMGMATNLTSDQAAEAFARISNIMQEPQKNIERMASTVVQLGNKGAATEAEIVQMALNMAGAGRTIGMSTRDVLSFSEALASIGISSEAGGSSFSRVMMEMAVAVDEQKGALKDFAATAGMSVDAFTTAFERGGTPALVAFIEGLARMRDEGGPVFQTLDKLKLGEIRVRRALLGAAGAGDMFARSIKTGNEAWDENIALSTEAEKRYKTQEWRLRRIWQKLKDIFITLGKDVMPIITKASKVVSGWLKRFRDLDKETRAVLIKGALGVAVLGPVLRLLGGIFGTLAGMVKMVRILKMGGGLAGALTGVVGPGVGGGAAGGAAGAGAAKGSGLLSKLFAGGRGLLSAAGGGGAAAAGLAIPAALIGAAIWDGFEERRRNALKDDLTKPGGPTVDSKKGGQVLESVGLGREDLRQYEETIDTYRRLRKEQGGSLTMEQEQALNQALQARRDIYEDIAELRREETRTSIRPLQTQLGLLDSLNGKLTEEEQKRINALIVQEKYGKATEMVEDAVKDATGAYVKSLGPLDKVKDGFQAWSSSAFAAAQGNDRALRGLRAIGSISPESFAAVVDAYGSIKDAVDQLADAQNALNWGWEGAPGGGGGGGGRKGGKGGTHHGSSDYPHTKTVPRGRHIFDVTQSREEIAFGGRHGFRHGRMPAPRSGRIRDINVNVKVARGAVQAGVVDSKVADQLADNIAGKIAVYFEEAEQNTPI